MKRLLIAASALALLTSAAFAQLSDADARWREDMVMDAVLKVRDTIIRLCVEKKQSCFFRIYGGEVIGYRNRDDVPSPFHFGPASERDKEWERQYKASRLRDNIASAFKDGEDVILVRVHENRSIYYGAPVPNFDGWCIRRPDESGGCWWIEWAGLK